MKKAFYSKVAGSLLLSAGLIASGAAAAADETITLNAGGVGIFGITHDAGESFTDTFLFTLTPDWAGWAAGSAAVGITNMSGTLMPNVDITNIEFFVVDGPDRNPLPTTFNDGAITFYPNSSLMAGSYGFTVTGTVAANVPAGSYAGNLSVTPVPEPATYAMLGVGIGLLAFTARRKTNNKLG